MQRIKNPNRLDAGIKGWIAKTARKHYWRVCEWYDYVDLVQDGMLCYCICNERYGHKVETQAHFMALVKRVFMNHIHDLAAKKSRAPDGILRDFSKTKFEDVDQALEYLTQPQQEEATGYTLLSQLPAELRLLLRGILANGDAPIRRSRLGHPETMNSYLCRLAGLNPDSCDVVQQLKAHFG